MSWLTNFQKTIKKALISTLSITLIAFAITVSFANYKQNAYADGVAEIAMELEHEKVLYAKNENAKLPMASTTKIMTGLIICEDCNLDEVITVPDEAVGIEGSSIYLKKGERISVKDLLHGLMLVSGNDAACALAIHHSKSVQNFVKAMNERAKKLGAENTNFANPNGLPNNNHYTTASNLCKIAIEALKNPVFAKVVATKHYEGDFRNFTNKNKLLNRLEGANGVKTGYTEKAGRCLVSSAKRKNMQVVCVVLNCYDMYERSENIINDCFKKYTVEQIDKNKIFTLDGKLYSLGQAYSLVVERQKQLKYKLERQSDDYSKVKLNIYIENNLIFSENLFNIN